MYPASKAWIVAVPTLPQNPVNFVFTSDLPPGRFGFSFQWFNNVWSLWVTLPSGEIRQAGCYPNAISWTGFFDYYFQMITTLNAIGQNDLNNITIVIGQI